MKTIGLIGGMSWESSAEYYQILNHLAKEELGAAGEQIKSKKLKKVGLLGTKFTMEQDFYKRRIFEKYGIEVIVPSEVDQVTVHNIIYNELVRGTITSESKNEYIKIIQKLTVNGAEGIILGCTEIPMLIRQDDVDVPIFDTTAIHAKYAFEFALKK